jgi:glycosyltransferase involved in cell wall biosynthesis
MTDRRLFFDIQTIQSTRFGERGIPRFATEVTRALLAQGAPVAALALNPLFPWPERLHPELARAPELTWNTAGAFRRARADGPLAYVVFSPFEVGRPVQGVLAPHVSGVPLVVMVHDLIPELVGPYDPHSDWGRVYTLRRRWARTADLLLAPSESTRRDLVERWDVEPDRIAVVGEAASPSFRPPEPGEDPAAALRRDVPAITRPFVLCVSNFDAHKNAPALIEAWGRVSPPVRAERQLVVVCRLPDDVRRDWATLARQSGLGRDDIVLTGYVDDTTLLALYQDASLLVFPSQYEGFGLPVLEAAACGCPAITSNTSSLPEILEWPDATFTPTDLDEIAGTIERALSDSGYRAELEAVCRQANQRHTWDRVVERLLAACAGMPAPAPTRPRRLRLGVIGGSEPLVDELATRADLDRFTSDRRARQPRDYRMFPAASLGPTFNPGSYDAVILTSESPVGESPVSPEVLARSKTITVAPADDRPAAVVADELCERALTEAAFVRPAEAPAVSRSTG